MNIEKRIIDTFIDDALRTKSVRNPVNYDYSVGIESYLRVNDLTHAAMGLSTEANEFLDVLKKHLFYGKELDIVNLKEELGDILWYMAIAMKALDTSFEDEMHRVIQKLKKRYTNKYSDDNAINRDLEGERKVLEDE